MASIRAGICPGSATAAVRRQGLRDLRPDLTIAKAEREWPWGSSAHAVAGADGSGGERAATGHGAWCCTRENCPGVIRLQFLDTISASMGNLGARWTEEVTKARRPSFLVRDEPGGDACSMAQKDSPVSREDQTFTVEKAENDSILPGPDPGPGPG